MKKLLIRGAIVIGVVLVGTVLAVALMLDGIIKKGVETVGPKITQVSVKLDHVNLSLLSGSGEIHGLVVGNPSGYTAPMAISVGSASLALSPGSLLSDKVVIQHIRVKSPEITIEGSPKKNNLTKILENVQSTAGGGGSAPEQAPESGPSKKLQVDEFVLEGAKVHYIVAGQTIEIAVPDIKLTGLGQGPEGITPGELTKLALSKLTDELAPLLADQAGKAVGSATEKVTKGVTDLFKKN
jgi:uncharacterized protein involved in outer membrane biogenesis